ncbi:hypothetical protein ASJ79_05640 [Mycobacterium sp. NAZ190054]|nr:hypothetical protein ASJ79_05640 [Mycobacterium sp. NAZ190054]
MVVYVVIAAVAFAVSVSMSSDLIARGLDDDAIGTGFAVLALFILSAAWPLTAVILAAAGIFVAIAKAVVAMTGSRR